ncbi:MarR family winged helix-turn-helix transcriptional regulator [Mumia sp. DW29H23]|uniref:MarR family winged helix-turn-helix transcriptional regulator n=1 Tax=Mumia sp. DW29H23 TaxID=3421241 RepID=UPI003D68BF30
MTDPTTTDVPWLSIDEQADWRSVVALLATLPVALDAQLKRDAGMNSFEYHVLAHLSEAPHGGVPMSDLAILAQGSPSRLSHAIARLERAGWVQRVACVEAGRRTSAVLTPEGLAKLREVAPAHVREVRRLVVDALEPEQLAALGEAARAIVARADPDLTCSESC